MNKRKKDEFVTRRWHFSAVVHDTALLWWHWPAHLCCTFFQLFEQLQSFAYCKIKKKKEMIKIPVKHIREVLWICTRAYIDMYTRFVSRASPFTQWRNVYVCVAGTRAHIRVYVCPRVCVYANVCLFVHMYVCVCVCVLTRAYATEWMISRCACGSECIFFSLCACVRS